LSRDAAQGRPLTCPALGARARGSKLSSSLLERPLLLVAGSAAALLAPVSAVRLAYFPAMATGAGASSSQLRDTSPTRQRTYPMPMSVQHMRVSNKATALRELHRSQRMHMEKLRNMKPGIDMKRPEQPKFLQYNAKRVQMEKERNLTIERENKILLGKMYSIMNSEPAYKTTQHKTISLNMSIRKQEYDRIARENQAIMQRILQREPEFDRARLDREWKETQRYLRNISEYPFILDQKTPKPSPTKKPLPPIKGARRRADRPPAPARAPPPARARRLTAPPPSHLQATSR